MNDAPVVWFRKIWVALLLLLATVHIVATRLAWSDIPLQTDTGIWAYMGSRILDGARLYRDLWDQKPPGIYYTFAAVEAIFGGGGDQALLWLDALLTAAIAVLTYRIARQAAGQTPAALATLLACVVLGHRTLADWGDNVEKYVSLFEVAALGVAARAWTSETHRPTRWLTVGVLAGIAAMYKQTGILFAVAATLVLAWQAIATRRRASSIKETVRPHGTSPTTAIALLWTGFAAVWLVLLVAFGLVGTLPDLIRDVFLYDLSRIGGAGQESSLLGSSEHWRDVARDLALAGVILVPAAWMILRLVLNRNSTEEHDSNRAGPSSARTTASDAPAAEASADKRAILFLSTIHAALVVSAFVLSPRGYGHYLLQAAPTAAILTAALLQRVVDLPIAIRKRRIAIVAIVLLVCAVPLRDHFLFMFDPASEYRQSYVQQARRRRAFVAALRGETLPGDAVLIWPPDDAVSYYAGRANPLECSNAAIVYLGKMEQLTPPMDELLKRLSADPPAWIVDWTPVGISPPDSSGTIDLLVPRDGSSLLDAPNPNHAHVTGRVLAPFKTWMHAHYGALRHIPGLCVIYRRDLPWREWRAVLTAD